MAQFVDTHHTQKRRAKGMDMAKQMTWTWTALETQLGLKRQNRMKAPPMGKALSLYMWL